MKVALQISHPQHVELFQCAADMLRGLANLTAMPHPDADPHALNVLDAHLAVGAVVRMTLSVGSAGPLGVLLQRVQPDGSTFDLVTIDAPPSTTPFRFGR